MRASLYVLAALGGLVSGLLAVSVDIFFVAGTMFALCMIPAVLFWHRANQTVKPAWIGIGSLVLLTTAAPWACVLAYIAVERTFGALGTPVLVMRGDTSVNNFVGTFVASWAWTACLAVALKAISGRWDWLFGLQMLAASAVVLLAATYDFWLIFYVGGLLASSLLFADSLARSLSRTVLAGRSAQSAS
jgi:hypothetical protein